LIFILILNFSLFAWDNFDLEEEKQEQYFDTWKVKQTKILCGNVLLMQSDELLYKFDRLIHSRGGLVSDGLLCRIKDEGGIVNKYDTPCEIIEVSKLNKNMVRIKHKRNYSFGMCDWYWVNLGNIRDKK
jgi:hypothetical protein